MNDEFLNIVNNHYDDLKLKEKTRINEKMTEQNRSKNLPRAKTHISNKGKITSYKSVFKKMAIKGLKIILVTGAIAGLTVECIYAFDKDAEIQDKQSSSYTASLEAARFQNGDLTEEQKEARDAINASIK